MAQVEDDAAQPLVYAGNLHVSGEWYVNTDGECLTVDPSWREARLCGGVLADHAGTGKTATVLRHCLTRTHAAVPASLVSRGTLIVVPLNLLSHWLAEVARWCPAAVVVQMTRGKDARQSTMQDLLHADFVITTAQFLRRCKAYLEVCDDALQATTAFARCECRSRAGFAAFARCAGPKVAPVIEAVEWRRVVVDEMHELFAHTRLLKTLRTLRCKFLWGVTATPDTSGPAAELLYALLEREKAHHPNLLRALLAKCMVRSSSPDARPCVQNLRLVHMRAADRDVIMSESGGLPDMILKTTCADVTDSVEAWRREELYASHSSHVVAAIREAEAVALALQSAAADADGTPDVAPLRQAAQRELLKTASLRERLFFVEQSIDALVQRSHVCPICMESSCGTITVCGHLFCRRCIADHVRRGSSSCPTCRQFIGHTRGVIVDGQASSRMLELVRLLQSIDEPTVVFVQWKGIVKNVRAVLRGSQLRVHSLEGNGSQRARTLEQFASGGVLLLSLEDSFAGLHLPHARHVVFTHAIVGSPAQVRAMEYQAISRCVRHGQTGSVCVHSIVVSEFAEEDMWRTAHDDIAYLTVSGATERDAISPEEHAPLPTTFGQS
jgi:hypothetical protein